MEQALAFAARAKRSMVWIAAASLLVLSANAAAHDTWLVPDEAQLSAPVPVGLALTSGIVFPVAEAGAPVNHLAAARFRLGGEDHSLLLPRPAPTALRLRLVPRAAGVAVAWVTLKPFKVDIEEPIVQVYLDEINAAPRLRALWARAGVHRQWSEHFAKHAKTFVRFGDAPGAADDWEKPVGAPYELLPLADPTRLRVGDSLKVRALKQGKPLAALELSTAHDRERRGPFVATDARGEASVSFDRPGWWLLRGTELRPVDNTGYNWASDWVSLSVYVSAR